MVMLKQGDIIKMNLDPKQGHEQQGYRPYICLSNKVVAQYARIAVFAPISNTPREFPFYVPVESKCETSGKVLLDQLVAIDFNARKYNYVETVSDSYICKLLEIVKTIFEKDN